MPFRRALTWIRQKIADNVNQFILAVLAEGPIPQHVAFIMDGNRRYARSLNKNVQEGHAEGFLALRRMLEISLRLKIKCVSVYAFSIENFKRSQEEVDALMAMVEEKLIEISRHGDLLDQYGVRLNVVGKIELLPEAVQEAVYKAQRLTKHNTEAIFNLCMPYTSRDEITTAVQACVRNSVQSQPADKRIITEDDIDHQLLTSQVGSPPVDILVRTSGVKRLSDFLLWQCCENTQIHFSSTYWPNFGLQDFIPILLDYQRKVGWH